MLERLQSAVKSVKDSKPSSLFSHRFVAVRRGSPAARSGQIQHGDQLEAVEGRSVLTLPHPDLAQILRRAGNTLRLTILPRSHTNASNLSEFTDLDPEGKLRKGQRSRQKDSRYYNVDLERGPTGFGFSLRGGSEYNMGLYVLGLMEGGPASRSQKIQVSDQLVEINGDSTVGMTHSQAVEQIRKGGHRIHLVLKKGNGYVPDYDHEGGAASPSSVSPEEPAAPSVAFSLTKMIEKRDEEGGEERRKSRRKGGGGELEEEKKKRGSPESERVRSDSGRRRRRGREKHTSTHHARKGVEAAEKEEEEEEGEGEERRERGWEKEREREKGRSSGERKSRGKGGTLEGEERERRESFPLKLEERGRSGRGETRDLKEERKRGDRGGGGGDGRVATETEAGRLQERAVFSFLMPLDEGHASDADSALSISEVSVSAADISFSESRWPLDLDDPLTLAAPGPWLVPSSRKLSQVLDGSRIQRRRGERGGGLWL